MISSSNKYFYNHGQNSLKLFFNFKYSFTGSKTEEMKRRLKNKDALNLIITSSLGAVVTIQFIVMLYCLLRNKKARNIANKMNPEMSEKEKEANRRK